MTLHDSDDSGASPLQDPPCPRCVWYTLAAVGLILALPTFIALLAGP